MTFSRGVYRIPYRTGTTVSVRQDHLTHDPVNRIDLKGTATSWWWTPWAPHHRIVAAADGVIRFIVDHFSENRPDQTPCNNNYVWIEHPSGEWTKYSHMLRASVTEDAGLSVGTRVRAGRILGFEGAVGCAHGAHLHFEVAVPIDPSDPISSDGYIRGGSARNRIPWLCGVPGHAFVKGASHQAGPCEPLMLEPKTVSFGSVTIGQSVTRSLTISNAVGADLRVSFQASTSGPFTWQAFDRVIPSGQRQTVNLQFRPSTHEVVRRSLTIDSSAPGSPHRVGLIGKGPGGF